MAAKPWLHELTAADLYAHCRIADERRALDLTASYSAWLPYRVLPPREASNEDLDALKPLYVELLQDPARIFDILDGPSTANDGRAVLLYALEYAMLTRGARCEVGGLDAENFPLHLPCKRIATNGRLLRWCRNALRAPQDRRAALIMSCVGLLRMVGDLLKNLQAPFPVAVEGEFHRDFMPQIWEALMIVGDGLGEDVGVGQVENSAGALVGVDPITDLQYAEVAQTDVDHVASLAVVDLDPVAKRERFASDDEEPPR